MLRPVLVRSIGAAALVALAPASQSAAVATSYHAHYDPNNHHCTIYSTGGWSPGEHRLVDLGSMEMGTCRGVVSFLNHGNPTSTSTHH